MIRIFYFTLFQFHEFHSSKFWLNIFYLWIIVTFVFVLSPDSAFNPFTQIQRKTMTAPQDDKFYIIQKVKALTAQLQEILNVSMRKCISSKYFNYKIHLLM